MGTISSVIDNIRIELVDVNDVRWSDANLLALVKRAIRRAEHVIRRNDISFGRAYETITTVVDEDEYALPADFMAPVILTRDGTHKELTLCDDQKWETILSAPELSNWLIRGSNLYVYALPQAVETLTLVYWPLLDIASYTVDSSMPWSGKLDEIIADYVALRCKNIDEMDVSNDVQLLTDLENNILSTYGTLNPQIVTMRGWLPTNG